MGILDRLKTGLVLTKDSLLVMRHHPKLFLFPVISGIAGLAFLVTFLGLTFGVAAVAPQEATLIVLVPLYFILTFISTFFAAALVHQTRSALSGGEVDLREGVAAAWDRKVPLAIWSIIAAVVGAIINGLQNSDSTASRGIGTAFAIAWTVATFFVVPVIVFERAGTFEMFKRSGSEFKSTWGETTISLVGVQVVSFVVALPFALIGLAFYPISVIITIAFVLAGALASFLVSQTLQGVIKTTLYLYSTEGVEPEEFENVDFEGLAKDRKGGAKTAPTGGFVGK